MLRPCVALALCLIAFPAAADAVDDYVRGVIET